MSRLSTRLVAALVLATSVAFAATHPNSRSSSRIVVRGETAAVEIAMQTRGLLEALGGLDENADGGLSAKELAGGARELEALLREHFELSIDGAPDDAGALELDARLLDARSADGANTALGESVVHATLSYTAPRAIEELWVRVTLFREQNPLHVDACSLVFDADGSAAYHTFYEGADLWHVEPDAKRRPRVFVDYWKQGIEHIATGFDHIAFLVALLLAAGTLRGIIGVISAFTLAHSITLVLATFEWIHVDSSFVEMAIALSITYVAALNLFATRPAARWIEAFLFGLVHGIGFAGLLIDSLILEPLKVPALVGFNLGVETGQLVIVAGCALACAFTPGERSTPEGKRFLAPRWLRFAGSVVIVALSLYWFVERTGWIG